MTDVFLGGTCNGSTWRDELKPMLDLHAVTYFDPVVPEWNDEAQARELRERAEATVCLYVLTPRMAGFYSVAEVVDDANKRPERTVFCYLPEDGDATFDRHQQKSLEAVLRMVERNGARVARSLGGAARACRDIVGASPSGRQAAE